MAVPALASAVSASAGSSSSSAVGAAATSGGMGILSSIINQGANKRKQKRQQEYTEKNMRLANDYSKQLMDYENAINNENWQKQIEREDYLLKNGKAIEAKALQDAGFNPALANGVSNGLPTTPAVGNVSANASAPPGAPFAPSAIDGSAIASSAISAMKVGAEINLLKAEANNLNEDAYGKQLENSFFGDTLALRTKMTNSDYEKILALNGFYASNPDLLRSIAESQKIVNDSVLANTQNTDTDSMLKLEQIGRTHAETAKVQADTYLSKVTSGFTLAQKQVLLDRNLREHYNDVGYLANKMFEVEHSDLDDKSKNEQLAMLRSMYDECSAQSLQSARLRNDRLMQRNQLSYQYKQGELDYNYKTAGIELQRTQMAWDNFFRGVNAVGSFINPWFSREEHRESRYDYFEHDREMQESRQQFQTTRDAVRESNRYSDKHDYYESTTEWFDENGYRHRQKHFNRKH